MMMILEDSGDEEDVDNDVTMANTNSFKHRAGEIDSSRDYSALSMGELVSCNRPVSGATDSSRHSSNSENNHRSQKKKRRIVEEKLVLSTSIVE